MKRRDLLFLLFAVISVLPAQAGLFGKKNSHVLRSDSVGIILHNDHLYYTDRRNTTIISKTTSGNALSVAAGDTAFIYIPYGDTLTLQGGPGKGVYPGGAGIRVPETSVLYVLGAGSGSTGACTPYYQGNFAWFLEKATLKFIRKTVDMAIFAVSKNPRALMSAFVVSIPFTDFKIKFSPGDIVSEALKPFIHFDFNIVQINGGGGIGSSTDLAPAPRVSGFGFNIGKFELETSEGTERVVTTYDGGNGGKFGLTGNLKSASCTSQVIVNQDMDKLTKENMPEKLKKALTFDMSFDTTGVDTLAHKYQKGFKSHWQEAMTNKDKSVTGNVDTERYFIKDYDLYLCESNVGEASAKKSVTCRNNVNTGKYLFLKGWEEHSRNIDQIDTMPAHDVIYEAIMDPIPVGLSFNNNEAYGTVTEPQSKNLGQQILFNVTPKNGYEVDTCYATIFTPYGTRTEKVIKTQQGQLIPGTLGFYDVYGNCWGSDANNIPAGTYIRNGRKFVKN